MRVCPAESAASRAFMPSSRWSLAKTTTRMLFAVATPMHMMDPISDGTLNVVWVMNRIQTMPAIAPGSAIRMMKRIQPGLEIDRHQQVDQHHRENHAQPQPLKRRLHGADLAANIDGTAARQARLGLRDDLLHRASHAAQIAAVHVGVNVVNRRHVVVVHNLRRHAAGGGRQVAEQLRSGAGGSGIAVGRRRPGPAPSPTDATPSLAIARERRRRTARPRCRRARRSVFPSAPPGSPSCTAASARRSM